ncbi:hypothetical protein P3T73_14980 [Kiritimatiellota bacterium B12222]|nr:hypothetical protein P3T73_14980 [Kiritimatiellota bacterium B12222]
MTLRLHPPAHSVPDNVWHTLWISIFASWFVWQTGEDLIELFTGSLPVTFFELRLLQGEGSAFQTWLNAFGGEDYPLLPGRILALVGWFLALAQVIRFLKPHNGFVGSLPSLLILFTLPGFSVWMSAAGSASWSVYFFIKGFEAISHNETKVPIIRGGVFVGIALLLHGIWLLPIIGLLMGCWEVFRYRLNWAVIGMVAVVLPLGLVLVVFDPDALARMIPGGSLQGELGFGGWGGLFSRYLLLVVSLLLLLVYGARRRGAGWWSLAFTMPLLVLEPLLASGPETVLLPLWIFVALGLSKVPTLLDVRFPRAYQSVVLCQLLLWAPAYLGTQPLKIYPPVTPDIEQYSFSHD